MNDVFTSIGDSFSSVTGGTGNLSDALDTVQNATVQGMRKQGFNVTK